MSFTFIEHVTKASPNATSEAKKALMKRETSYGLLEESVSRYGIVQTIEYLRLLIKETSVQSPKRAAELAKLKCLDSLLDAAYSAIAIEEIKNQGRTSQLD